MKKLILLLPQFFFFLFSFCQQFSVSYSKTAYDKPFTGKVFLYLNKENHEPRSGPTGIESFPCFAIEVKNVQPGQPVVFDDKAISYPAALSDLERNEYYVQAVWDRDLGGRAVAESPGNIYSKAIKVKFTKDLKKVFSIQCTEVIPEQSFKDTKFMKELKVQSALLSAFHHRPYSLGAAVLLPKTYYDQPQRKYPVLFHVFGYGGDYHFRSGDTVTRGALDTIETIVVYLDGNCPLGHCVYANSENNGPWGDALTQELIPEIEKLYRCNAARLFTGHSSGGWTVFWLQTHYPTNSLPAGHSPDPVDFRDFQQINLYAGKNLFYGKDSVLRIVGTVAGRIPWIR